MPEPGARIPGIGLGPSLSYPLDQGYVDHWLVAGPVPQDALAAEASYMATGATVIEAPILNGAISPRQLDSFAVADTTLQWQVYRCEEDHLLHLGDTYPLPQVLTTWAYVALSSPKAQLVKAVLMTSGPADIWCNGVHVASYGAKAGHLPGEMRFDLNLTAGENRLLVRLTQAAAGPTAYLLGLKLVGTTDLSTQLPCATEKTALFQALEMLFDLATLDRELFIGDDILQIHWPADLTARCEALGISPSVQIMLRLQKADGRIYAETTGTPRPGGPTQTIRALHLLPGAYQLVLMPDLQTYATERVRVQRILDINVLNAAPMAGDARPYSNRLYDAVHMAMRLGSEPLAALAAMTLNAWTFVKVDGLRAQLATLGTNILGRERTALALLAIRARYGDHGTFPSSLAAEIDAALQAPAFLNDPAAGREGASQREACAVVREGVRLLVAERYGDATGQAQSIERLTAWLFEKGRFGLQTLAGDGESLDTLIFTLSQLADLAQNTTVRELAAILLDKLLFTLALTSFEGMGAGGPLGTTAAVGRALWGTGVINTHLWGVVGLANAPAYPVPQLVVDIAHDAAADGAANVQAHECHRGRGDAWSYERTTYRTPDAQLASWASDAGQPVPPNWYALLDATTRISTNCPIHAGDAAIEGKGFWHGDVVPARIVQWRDSLIVQYTHLLHDRPTERAGLGFTHAHFPTAAFDEYVLRGGWAFARKGEAYLALKASAPMTLSTTGRGAHRELRVPIGAEPDGPDRLGSTTWLCQLGRAGDDGDFADFQARVLASEVAFQTHVIRWTTIRHEALVLAQQGSLTVNGQPHPVQSDLHYATPYCTVRFPADVMDIQLRDTVLRLDFSE